MRCPRCNAQLVENASFCGICGNPMPVAPARVPEAGPSLRAGAGNEATIAEARQHGQWGMDARRTAAPAWSGQPANPPAPPPGWSGGQPGAMQGSADPWSQQPAPGNWTSAPAQQPPSGVDGAMQPGNLNRYGSVARPPVRKRRRAGRVWLSIFLTLIVLAALAVGAWFVGVRPYLHNLAQTQLDQALTTPENQVLLTMSAIPSGVQLPASLRVIRSTEDAMNARLSGSNSDPVQNLHMTITPAGLTLSFAVYGQTCTVSALPILSNGQLQVTNVQVQGLLNLIMSNDELTSELNSNLQNFSSQMTHKIQKITLLDHEMDVQLA